jgi:NAD(P)-dependent dehydrogenase (short-subunit alcohol dehydrogenase family)
MPKVLVIGASSGIGQGCAKALGSFDIELFTPTIHELDIRYPRDVQEYLYGNGPFNYIIYSAGANVLAWVGQLGFPSSMMEELFETNCAGFVHLMGSHERMFPAAEGSAVVISSDAAHRPMRGSTAYCASKAALDAAVRCMARELAPRWRVNAIAPGMTDGTRMTEQLDRDIPAFRNWTSEQARAYETGQIPMGRRADVGEVASVAVQTLLGPAYLTGAIIEINGGR